MHVFQLTEEIRAPQAAVFNALTDLALYRRYNPSLTALEQLTPGRFAAGTCWRERRDTLLFLRDWATCECIALEPLEATFVTLDDGFNNITFHYRLSQGKGLNGEWTNVSLEVACFQRHGNNELVPSAKLACMLRKQDKDVLARLKAFLEPYWSCGAQREAHANARRANEQVLLAQ